MVPDLGQDQAKRKGRTAFEENPHAREGVHQRKANSNPHQAVWSTDNSLSKEDDDAEDEGLIEDGGPLRYAEEEGRMKDVLDFFMDVKLAGKPLQCSESDGTCDEMKWVLSPYSDCSSRYRRG